VIEFIKYTVNGIQYQLTNNDDGTWSSQQNAPSVAGNYSLLLEISENGMISIIDSSDSRYDFFLEVIAAIERVTCLHNYVPEYISSITEFNTLFDVENAEFDAFYAATEKTKVDLYIPTASNDGIQRIENFFNITGVGTLDQRKKYLMSLFQNGNKLTEQSVKSIIATITGSNCIVEFFGANELDNPQPGKGVLQIQVFSPDNSDYRYEDIVRALNPLVPTHVKLLVVKFFATWNDVKMNFLDWGSIRSLEDWRSLSNYIPPQ
jgi:hypothetical protein